MSMTIAPNYGLLTSSNSTPTPLEQYEAEYTSNPADSSEFSGIAQSLLQGVTAAEGGASNLTAGVSMLATAEGGLSNVTNQLGSMDQLAMEAGDGAMNASDQKAISAQYSAEAAGVQGTLNSTTFNGQPLLSGNARQVQFQAGGNPSDTMNASIGGMSLASLGVPSTMGSSGPTLSAIQTAMQNLDSVQAKLGATSEGFAAAANVESVMSTNLQTSLGQNDGSSNLTAGLSALSQGQTQQQAQVSVDALENQNAGAALNLIA